MDGVSGAAEDEEDGPPDGGEDVVSLAVDDDWVPAELEGYATFWYAARSLLPFVSSSKSPPEPPEPREAGAAPPSSASPDPEFAIWLTPEVIQDWRSDRTSSGETPWRPAGSVPSDRSLSTAAWGLLTCTSKISQVRVFAVCGQHG